MFTLIIAIIKALFVKNTEESVSAFVEAMGVIVKAESKFEKIEIIHNGGNGYTITTTGKLTGNKTSVYRHNAEDAMNYFNWTKAFYKMA